MLDDNGENIALIARLSSKQHCAKLARGARSSMPSAKGKIQALLRELDLSDSGGVDAALAAAGAASTSDDFDAVVGQLLGGQRATSPPVLLRDDMDAGEEDTCSTAATDDTDQARNVCAAPHGPLPALQCIALH